MNETANTPKTRAAAQPGAPMDLDALLTVEEFAAWVKTPLRTVRARLATMAVVEHEETRAKTELGAAQKDTARELSAKLASLSGIVWVGVALFLFGLASLFYPPLQAIIGSVTTSVAITAGGVALMILPTVVVGHEMLILGGVAVAVGGWFLAHRYGTLRGMVKATEAAGVTAPADKTG